MNIFIVNSDFKMGGVQRVSTELANSMHEKGNNISLIDFSGINDYYYPVNNGINMPNAINIRTIKRKIVGRILKTIYTFNKKSINTFYLYKEQTLDLITYLKSNKCDILIMNTGILTSLIPFVKKELPNIRIIAWQHNEYEVYMNHYHKEFIDNYLLGIKAADGVICLTARDQEKFNQLNRNTTFIYNPLTINNKESKISNLMNKQIIFVGRLILRQKGLDHLIQIAKNLKGGWKILVAGDGPDKERLIQMIKDDNLDNKIILKGPLDGEELVDFYLSGSVFISTSRWEGFGLVLTEAMALGLPVVSFNNSGPNEILSNGKYGILVEKNNLGEFSKELNLLIENPKLRESFQKKSIRRVEDFKREVIINQWEAYLKEIL